MKKKYYIKPTATAYTVQLGLTIMSGTKQASGDGRLRDGSTDVNDDNVQGSDGSNLDGLL